MRLLILILCLFLAFHASAENFTSTESSTAEQANTLMFEGLQRKDVDTVLEALEMGAQLEAVVPDFGSTLYTLAHFPEFYCAQTIELIDAYLSGGSAALAQFRLNRQTLLENEARSLLYAQVEDVATHAVHNSASDAGSEAEYLHEHDFDAGSDADMPADDILADNENATTSFELLGINPAYEYDAALSLTLSLSFSSPSGQ